MKIVSRVLLLAVVTGFLSNAVAGANGPKDSGGVGNGIIGFGIGPAIGYYGGTGFGPAILGHYDHGMWEVGPGTISIGGQFGMSFFWNSYDHLGIDYNEAWTNLGFIGRAAYHYGWDVPGLDTYAGFGAGTRLSFYSDDGDYTGKSATNIGFLPTAFFGGSYYFNDMMGINVETGYNFSFFSFGLNFRIVQ